MSDQPGTEPEPTDQPTPRTVPIDGTSALAEPAAPVPGPDGGSPSSEPTAPFPGGGAQPATTESPAADGGDGAAPVQPPYGVPVLGGPGSAPGGAPPSAAAPGSPPPPPPPLMPGGEHVGGPPPAKPVRSSRAALVAVLAVFALGAAAFGVTQVLNSGDGGFDSPDAAVAAFFAALDKEDGLGMLETLAPGERKPLTFEVKGFSSELTRLGIIKKTDLNAVPGVNLETKVEVDDPEQIVPGVDRVPISGTVSAGITGSEIPVGDALEALVEQGRGEPLTIDDADPQKVSLGDGGLEYLVTVKVDGRFYVSIFHTIAELARDGQGTLDPDKAIQPVGGDSPEDTVNKFLEAAGDLDVAGVIGMLPPDEMAAVQLYGQLFVDDAQSSADDAKQEDGLKISFDDMTYDVSDAGDGAKVVTPTGGVVKVQVDGDKVDVTVKDGCVTIKATGDVADSLSDTPYADGSKVCGDSDKSELTDALGSDVDSGVASDLQAIVDRAGDAKVGIVVTEVGGKFYVSPIRTLADPFRTILGLFDRSDLEDGGLISKVIDGGPGVVLGSDFSDSFSDSFSDFSEFSDFSDGPIVGGDFCVDTGGESSDGSTSSGSGFCVPGGTDGPVMGPDECALLSDMLDASDLWESPGFFDCADEPPARPPLSSVSPTSTTVR